MKHIPYGYVLQFANWNITMLTNLVNHRTIVSMKSFSHHMLCRSCAFLQNVNNGWDPPNKGSLRFGYGHVFNMTKTTWQNAVAKMDRHQLWRSLDRQMKQPPFGRPSLIGCQLLERRVLYDDMQLDRSAGKGLTCTDWNSSFAIYMCTSHSEQFTM